MLDLWMNSCLVVDDAIEVLTIIPIPEISGVQALFTVMSLLTNYFHILFIFSTF